MWADLAQFYIIHNKSAPNFVKTVFKKTTTPPTMYSMHFLNLFFTISCHQYYKYNI